MDQVAQISFDGGRLLLPARGPYDREVVFEEAEFFARRHGSAGLQIDRQQILVSVAPTDPRSVCEVCRHPIGTVNFLIERRQMCGHCAKSHMLCPTTHLASPPVGRRLPAAGRNLAVSRRRRV